MWKGQWEMVRVCVEGTVGDGESVCGRDSGRW